MLRRSAPLLDGAAVTPLDGKVALITGAARRLGAAIARGLHAAGADVVLHYHTSRGEAERLAQILNQDRPDSAMVLGADLLLAGAADTLADRAAAWRGRLDVLVNNASTFYPTPLGTATAAQWDDLVGSNVRAPFFLSQAAAPSLRAAGGCIVNMVDVYAESPLDDYPIYSVAKAGMAMLTKALAKELAPQVRVNGVAPGSILWPALPQTEEERRAVVQRSVLKRRGEPEEIAAAVRFLVCEATYTTGAILTVDGGRHLVI